jgi:hypothetical protein
MSQSDWPEEGRRSDHPDRPGQRPPEDWGGQAPPPPSGMSGGMKACLVVLCVVGFCCLLCCGVVGWFGYSMVPKVSEDAANIDATRDSIATIKLPPGFKPKASIKFDNFFMSMPMVVYENPGHATLMMMQMRVKMQAGGDFNQVMRQQFDQRRTVEVGRMEKSKTETKTLKIKGRDCPFVFTTGEVREPAGGAKPGAKPVVHHEIEGTFDGKDGQAVIVINFDDTYKEADIVKMLEGIQ